MEFTQSQIAYKAKAARWNDVSRGLKHVHFNEPNAEAASLGIEVQSFGTKLEDEGIMAAQHRWWLKVLTHGPKA
jgi:benzoate/toluate 1,2-dioxygenase alpha subunit